MDCKICSNNIANFILSSKQYCRKNQVYGEVFVLDEDKICFASQTKLINRFILPKGLKKISVNVRTININDKGITSDACTIKYLDKRNKPHEITIGVGTSYVDVKN